MRCVCLGGRLKPFRSNCFFLVLLAVVSGCFHKLPAPPPRQNLSSSFGGKVFSTLCQRIAYQLAIETASSTPKTSIDVSNSVYRNACERGIEFLPEASHPKLAEFIKQRGVFVHAVDAIFADALLDPLQSYLVRLLPLTDDGTLPRWVNAVADSLFDAMQDDGFTDALARASDRRGYQSPRYEHGIFAEWLPYPTLQTALRNIVDPMAPGEKGYSAFVELMNASGFELEDATVSTDQDSSERTLRLALTLLLSESDSFSSGLPVFSVRRDDRGVAVVKHQDSSIDLPTPFPDLDRDVAEPDRARRGNFGEALNSQGQPLYDYFDADRTMLAAFLRDTSTLLTLDQDPVFRLLYGGGALLGERAANVTVGSDDGTQSYRYKGFAPKSSAIIDILYGYLQLLRDPSILDGLDAIKLLISEHESVVARVIGSAFLAKDYSKIHPEALPRPQSTIVDELMDLARRMMAIPGLTESLFEALRDPRSANLAPMLANFIKYKNVHVLDAKGKSLVDTGFSLPVDRAFSDSGTNRSILQRFMHIIHNANGAPMCNKEGAIIKLPEIGIQIAGPFKQCALFEVKNGAVFYANTIARERDEHGALTNVPKSHLRIKTENMPEWLATIVKNVGADQVIRLLSETEGMGEHPTAEALNRLLFSQKLPGKLSDVQDTPLDIYGQPYWNTHTGSALSWEARHAPFSCGKTDPCRFIDAVQPIVQAFADHDAMELFVDFLSVLHRHWPSAQSNSHQAVNPGATEFVIGDGYVSYEPFLLDLLEKTDLVEAIRDVLKLISTLTLSNQKSVESAMIEQARFLVDPERSPGLTYRDGRHYSVRSDGTTIVPGGVSPFYLIADGYALKRRAFEVVRNRGEGERERAWDLATTSLIDLFLTVEGVGSYSRFRNPHLVPGLKLLIEFAKTRIEFHAQKGDVAHWVGTELPDDLERALTGPAAAALVDWSSSVYEQNAMKQGVYELLSFVLDRQRNPGAYSVVLSNAVNMAQAMLDEPSAVFGSRVIGRAMRTDRDLVRSALGIIPEALSADPELVIQRILKGGFFHENDAATRLRTLMNLLFEVNRVEPGSAKVRTQADYQQVLNEVGTFLGNEKTGLSKFLKLVRTRCGGTICVADTNP